MRSKKSLDVLQKTYDQAYLMCSTAIYFESKSNEDQALRSWKDALQLIQSYERTAAAHRSRTSSSTFVHTEKALTDSLGDLKLQCLERIDTIEVLKLSRKEDEEKQKLMREYNGGLESPRHPMADPPRREPPPTNYFFLDEETDDNMRPPHDRQPSSSSVATVSSSTLGPSLPPNERTVTKKAGRSPSPEKKSLLTTLRNSSGGSGGKTPRKQTPKPTGPESVAAAARAATRAWGTPNRGGLSAGRSFPDGSSLTVGSRGSFEGSTAELLRTRSDSPVTHTPIYSSLPPLHSSSSAANLNGGSQSVPPPSSYRPPPPIPPPPPPMPSESGREYFPDPSAYMMPPSDPYPYTPHEQYQHVPQYTPYAGYPDISSLGISAAPDVRNQPPPPLPVPQPPRATPNPPSPTLKTRPTPPPPPPKKPFIASKPSPAKRLSAEIRNKLETDGNSSITETRKEEFKWPSNPLMNGKLEVPSSGSGSRRPSELDKYRRSSNRTDSPRNASDSSTRKEKRKSSSGMSGKIPVYENGDNSDSADTPPELSADEEWNQRVKTALKSLDKGVDQNAAKQILNEIVIHGDEVHWEDIAGLDVAKQALKEAVVYPFLRPDLFMGLREPARGMLLFGPPGTGKTMLARAVATESKSTFFSISASSLTSKYLGESEKLVRALFQLAKALAPSIIFIDEIDSLLSTRSGSGEHEATRRIKTEFLIQWSDLQRAAAGKEVKKSDGDPSRVLVLAATNLPWAIDEAARRRFVRRQYIPLPDGPVRVQQLRHLMGQQKHTLTERDMRQLEILTEDFSGSDITALAKDAAMGPLRSLGEALLHMRMDDIRPIMLEDFRASLKSIRPSVSKEGLQEYEDWARNFGERAS